MKLVMERVLRLETVADCFGCHLRIWKDDERAILLAGQLHNLKIPHSRIEDCVDELVWRYVDDGRPFSFFCYTPADWTFRKHPDAPEPSSPEEVRQLPLVRVPAPFTEVVLQVDEDQYATNTLMARASRLQGTTRPRPPFWELPVAFHDPSWDRLTLEEFEERVGGPVAVFPKEPEELYSVDTVQAYIANGCRPTDILWDPYGLLRDLADVQVLDRAVVAHQADRRPGPVDAELFRLAAHQLAGDSRGKQRMYEFDRAHSEQARDALLRPCHPSLDAADWRLLDRYREDPAFGDHTSKWYQQAAFRLRGALEVGDLSERYGDELLEALRRAERQLTWFARLHDPHGFRADDHPPSEASVMLEVLGDVDRTYLATVDWRPPRPGDESRLAQLAAKVGGSSGTSTPQPNEELCGYDPFGRLVLRLQEVAAYVVEWPFRLPSTPYPDAAMLVGVDVPQKPGSRPVYVRLPDGRLDLLPADPSTAGYVPRFKWGYSGGSPGWLEAQIIRACCEDYRKLEGDSRLHPSFRHWLEWQIEEVAQDRLELSVGEIRSHYLREHG